jgi:hypothetical protein
VINQEDLDGQNMLHVWESGAYRFLVGKPEGMRPLGRPRRRWNDTIEMDLRGVGWGYGMDRSC